MLPSEADWISAYFERQDNDTIGTALNIGSSTAEFHARKRSFIDDRIFRPLARRGVPVIHCDIKEAEGVDIVADIMNDDDLERLRSLEAKTVLCSNMLEHVPSAPMMAERLARSGPLPEPVRRRRWSLNLMALGTAGCLIVGLSCFRAERLAGWLLSAIAGEAAASNLVFPAKAEITTRSPMLDAVIQNTPGYSEGYAVGVPRTYDWCSGSYKPPQYSGPPAYFTAVSGWGQIYQDSTEPTYTNPNARVEVANSKTYVRRRSTGEWVLVQNQANNPIVGGHFVPDFKDNAARPMNVTTGADGTASFDAPTSSYNDHFWSEARGTYQPGDVDGVYVQMDLRVSDPKMNLVANAGADWWRDSTADFVQGFANNPTAGTSNWIKLSSGWSTLRFYSPSTSEFMAAPPPMLASDQLAPTVTRRRAHTSAPCRSRFLHPLPKELLQHKQR